MPPRILAPNGNGRYRCSDLICAVRNGLQLNDIWDDVKALFPLTREFICLGRLPWDEATGRMVGIFVFPL